jgi:hypothetical protein
MLNARDEYLTRRCSKLGMPCDWALENGYMNVVKLLMDHGNTVSE